jgi:hypothetical protein
MSSKSKGQNGAFGGKKGKVRKAQKRWMANKGLSVMSKSLPGARLKIMDEPTTHITQRSNDTQK